MRNGKECLHILLYCLPCSICRLMSGLMVRLRQWCGFSICISSCCWDWRFFNHFCLLILVVLFIKHRTKQYSNKLAFLSCNQECHSTVYFSKKRFQVHFPCGSGLACAFPKVAFFQKRLLETTDIFYRHDAVPDFQSTTWKHWWHNKYEQKHKWHTIIHITQYILSLKVILLSEKCWKSNVLIQSQCNILVVGMDIMFSNTLAFWFMVNI